MSRLDDQLIRQFHRWELRGRGWRVFSQPVYPELPFVPFNGHYQPSSPPLDDRRKPTFLSSFVQTLSRKLSTEKPPAVTESDPEDEPEPTPLTRDSLIEFQASLPDKLDVSREAFEQFLLNLSLCREPIAFELIGTHKKVTTQFAVASADAPLLRRQLQAFFPEAVFVPREGGLEQAWEQSDGNQVVTVEFGLEREFMLPLASGKLDPFIGLIGALSELQPDELGLFQVLWQPVQHPWAESITDSVTHQDGKPFFVNAPELASAAENKVARPLFAAVVRILIRAGEEQRMLQLARDLAGSLRVFAHPNGNELIPLRNDNYGFEEHIEDVLCRQTRRSGMLLNSDELIGFVHIPSSTVRSPAFQRQTAKTKAAPSIVRHENGLLLGENEHAGETVSVQLTSEQRVRHCHIIGATGTGKSTLLFNLIQQAIENGEGIAVLDPNGDLIDRILGIIPSNRIDDVILIDPSDTEYSVGFNILSAHSDIEKTLLASDLVAVFQRLSTSWGDQMNSVLQNAILAFLESDQIGTIADLRRFLIEAPYRNEFLKSVKDAEVVYYWQKSFPHLSGNKSIGSILTRLDSFLAQKPIRHMVSQPENRLDFAHIMDSGKIFLAKLPEGLLGRENSYLLGTLLVSKFQQIVMSRQAQQIEARRLFNIVIDEFANFITPSMAEILSGARKYRIGLTLAHHELHQLQGSPEVASAVMTHPFTRIVFRVGDDDAKKLAEGFSYFESKDLRNLETGQAVARVERSDFDFNLTVPLPVEPDKDAAAARRQEVITGSRRRYGTARADVEAMLAKSRTTPEPPASSPPKPVEPKQPAPVVFKLPKAVGTPEGSLEAVDDESQHNAIKELIRVQAEALDYSVTFEEFVSSGKGRADVVLRRGNRSIACEITVTTPVEYEVGNLTKCLKADFSHIVAISKNRKKLNRIQELLAGAFSPDQIAKVGFYAPEEFISKLHDWAIEDPGGGTLEQGQPRKRKIALNATQLSDKERRQRENDLLEKLAQAMKRK
jgi:Type IV secretion-system coupling protein DNA-binding domain